MKVEVLEDRCLPAFLEPVTYAGGLHELTAGDFNNDGLADLVGISAGVAVLLSNGDGTFQPARTSPADATHLDVGDFNGDGNLDVVTGSSGANSLSIFPGNGDGTFRTPRTFTLPTVGKWPAQQLRPRSLAVGDFNADGKSDLALTAHPFDEDSNSTNYSFTYTLVYFGKGDGSFTLKTNTLLDSHTNPALGFVLGDVNADGRLDILTLASGSTGWGYATDVYLQLGNGDGALSDPVRTSYSGSRGNPLLTDLNRDGRLDLVTSGSPGHSLQFNLGNGDGTFQPTTSMPAEFFPNEVAAADVNRDGLLDLLVSGANAVFLGNGDGTFRPGPKFPGVGGWLPYLTVADFNGDGFPDVTTSSFSLNDPTGSVAVALNDAVWDGAPPPLPALAIRDVTVTEGNSGTTSAVFTVMLSSTSAEPVIVYYTTADGTATADSDYQAVSGTLTFAPGETSKSITVLVHGDGVGEPNETFFVNLSNPTNATLADGQGVGTIVDDEPRLTISDASVKEGHRGKTLLTFTVTLSFAYDAPVTVHYATQDSTAKAGDKDYLARSGMLTFAPGETTKTITIEMIGDKKKEADETFFVNLFGADGAWLLDAQALAVILNDDK